MHGVAQLYYLPSRAVDRDDETLKLVVLGFDRPIEKNGELSEATRQTVMSVLEKHGQVLRQHRNTLVFCIPDREAIHEARGWAVDYLSWRRIQQNATDWDRIGATQQALVKEQLEQTKSASLQSVTNAYSWALIPAEDKLSASLSVRPIALGTYGPGKKIAPMVWDSLTAKTPTAQWVLITLTAETFMERYGAKAWPESEKWVTTAQLWQRFTSQVGLPILATDKALLDMLRQGQHEGLLAIGSLTDAEAPRDQRDSYLYLYFQEANMPPNVPIIGERWLVMRPQVYRQIAEQPEQVTPDEILDAVTALGGDELKGQTLWSYVAKDRKVDESSFQQALATVVKDQRFDFEVNGVHVSEIPTDSAQVLAGILVKEKAPLPPPKTGRTIVIQGNLQSHNDMGPFFKKVLQPIVSQQPSELTIQLTIHAHFEEDPGSGLDAALDDGFDNNAFPGLSKKDSRGV